MKTFCFNNVVFLLSEIKPKVYILVAILALVLGFAINSIDPMPMFIIKGPLGFVLIVTLLFSLNYFRKKSEKLRLEMVGDPVLFSTRKTFTNRYNSNYNYIASLVMPAFFCFISVRMNFVEMTPIGIYSLLCLFIVVFIAFIVYQQYIYLFLLLWELFRHEYKTYNKLIPESTKWYVLVAEMSGSYKNLFFILGSFFVILFVIFSPYNTVEIIFYLGQGSEYFWPLFLSWLIIFFAIIILFPVSALFRNFLLSKILQKMKSYSIEYYTELSTKSRGVTQLLYLDIIGRVNKDGKLPQNGFSHVIPALTTFINFVSIVLTILVELKDLGHLF